MFVKRGPVIGKKSNRILIQWHQKRSNSGFGNKTGKQKKGGPKIVEQKVERIPKHMSGGASPLGKIQQDLASFLLFAG